MPQPSILVVDDEPDNFDVIETLLSEQDYQLHYAANGYDAIVCLETVCPDVILLDVMMPDLDGIEVCRRIKNLPNWQIIPIIMVTSLNTKEDLARCLQAGADDFISKPVHGIELRARVHSMLRIKQQYDRIQSFSKLQRDTIQLLRNNLQTLRGTVASSFPQELNSSLTSMLGNLRSLMDPTHDMNLEKIRVCVGMAHQSATQLEKLTQRFLTYLQLEVSDTLPEPLQSSSAHVLVEAIATTQAAQAKRSPDLVLDVEEAEVCISPGSLKQILEEVLDNAFKFSQAGTPINLKGRSMEGKYHLWISDQGRGMTHEQIASIGAFMQFERTIQAQAGIGLGLKIAKRTLELYGGRLLISSVYQQGTMVHIIVPLENLQQRAERLAQAEFETLVIQLGGLDTSS